MASTASRLRFKLLAGLTLGLGVASAGTVAVPSAVAKKPPVVRPTQAIAVLSRAHNVSRAPHAHAHRVGRVPARTPITGVSTVLPVVGRAKSKAGGRWLRVMLPGRPNGSKGWITQRGTELTTTPWHVVVRTSSRRVLVYRRAKLTRSFAAVVGKPSTPTPHGRFFVEESLRMPPGAAGGPFALALSARSNVLQEFDGGPGQIAIHGVANLGGTPGTAVSHGCVRLANGNVTWLAAHVGAGAPVAITP